MNGRNKIAPTLLKITVRVHIAIADAHLRDIIESLPRTKRIIGGTTGYLDRALVEQHTYKIPVVIADRRT